MSLRIVAEQLTLRSLLSLLVLFVRVQLDAFTARIEALAAANQQVRDATFARCDFCAQWRNMGHGTLSELSNRCMTARASDGKTRAAGRNRGSHPHSPSRLVSFSSLFPLFCSSVRGLQAYMHNFAEKSLHSIREAGSFGIGGPAPDATDSGSSSDSEAGHGAASSSSDADAPKSSSA